MHNLPGERNMTPEEQAEYAIGLGLANVKFEGTPLLSNEPLGAFFASLADPHPFNPGEAEEDCDDNG